MNKTRKAYLALGMAVAQALALATFASAQVQSGQDGRAMDANNRVGSGGLNQPTGAGPGRVSPNQIIYGNVTGGKAFRGPVVETDPGAFFGPTAGRLTDRFIAGSSAAPQPYQPQVDLNVAQPFYGVSRAAPPPPGSIRLGFTGAYLGTSLSPGTDFGMNQFADTSDQLRSQPLGVSTVLGTQTRTIGTPAGEAYMEGPDNENQQTVFSGSALYGIQALRPMNAGQETSGLGTGVLQGPGDRFRVNSAEMRRMRNELETGQQQPENQNPNNPNNQPNSPRFDERGNPLENPTGANPNAFNNGANGFTNDIQSAQATQRRFTIVSPELQSTQYREMRQRLAQYENPQFAQMEAQHRARLERQIASQKIANATSQPAPSALGSSAMLQRPGVRSASVPAPMKVTSLATGVRAKGLHDMLASAEDLMRQGKFQSAIDRYDIAAQIAPNNPLVSLGRANAELGAGAYRLAGTNLHRVFGADHATLVAQYDLKSWFPSERLSAIQSELRKLSTQDATEEMPEFLLAYLAYNQDDTAGAARHLTEARKRAPNGDPVLDLMEADWKLPQGSSGESSPATRPANGATPPDLNK